jgi:cell division protein FtsQ
MSDRQPSSPQPRRAARPRARRFVAGLRLIAVVLALGLGGELWWALSHSPRLALACVDVRGAQALSPAEIVTCADLRPGVNVLTLKSERVAGRIRRHVWVRDAEVRRRLPNGVTIRVRELEPLLTIRCGDEWLWLSRDGVAYAPSGTAADPGSLPRVTGIDLRPEQAGTLVDAEPVRTVLAAYDALRREPSLQVAEVSAEGGERVSATLSDGTIVRLGTPDGLPSKMKRLREARALLERQGQRVEYIDVSGSKPVVWKPRGEDGI